MLREEVEMVQNLISGAVSPLSARVDNGYLKLEKECDALKKEVADLKKQIEALKKPVFNKEKK